MPRVIEEEVGKVIRRRTVKTFGDKVKEFLQGLAGFAVLLFIIASVFG